MASVVIAVLLALALAAPPAAADDSISGTWYWARQRGPIVLDPRLSGIPEGRLGVAALGGDEPDKQAFLMLPPVAVADGGTVEMRIGLDPDASSSTVFSVASLWVCLVTERWEAAPPAGGQPWTERPGEDCSVRAEMTFEPSDGVFTAPITDIARAWADGRGHGLTIRPAPTGDSIFQYALDPTSVTIATTPVPRRGSGPLDGPPYGDVSLGAAAPEVAGRAGRVAGGLVLPPPPSPAGAAPSPAATSSDTGARGADATPTRVALRGIAARASSANPWTTVLALASAAAMAAALVAERRGVATMDAAIAGRLAHGAVGDNDGNDADAADRSS